MANPTWVSSNPNSNAASISAVGVAPATVAAGDYLIAHQVVVSGTGGIIAVRPAGWSSLRTDFIGAAPGRRSNIELYGPCTGSEGGTSYTWTIGSAVDSTTVITRIAGAHQYTAVDGVPSGTTLTSDIIPSVAISPMSAEALLLLFLSHAAATTYNAISGMTERYDASGTSRTYALNTEALASSGSTGTRTAQAVANAAQIAQMVAIQPPPTTNPVPPDAVLSSSGFTGTLSDVTAADANWMIGA